MVAEMNKELYNKSSISNIQYNSEKSENTLATVDSSKDKNTT